LQGSGRNDVLGAITILFLAGMPELHNIFRIEFHEFKTFPSQIEKRCMLISDDK
jgi:hypothetical protein